MSITVTKIALSEQESQAEGKLLLTGDYLGLIAGVKVECQVRVGTLNLSIGEIGQLQEGQILTLKEKTHEPIDILVNNQVIARGELMSAEDCFAIQITEVASC